MTMNTPETAVSAAPAKAPEPAKQSATATLYELAAREGLNKPMLNAIRAELGIGIHDDFGRAIVEADKFYEHFNRLTGKGAHE